MPEKFDNCWPTQSGKVFLAFVGSGYCLSLMIFVNVNNKFRYRYCSDYCIGFCSSHCIVGIQFFCRFIKANLAYFDVS